MTSVIAEAPHVGDVAAQAVQLCGAPGLAAAHLYAGVVLLVRVNEGELAAASDDRTNFISMTLTVWVRGCGDPEVKCQGWVWGHIRTIRINVIHGRVLDLLDGFQWRGRCCVD